MACGVAIPAVLAAQTLTLNSPIAFGSIEVASLPLAGNITLGTNGTLGYPANASGTGFGTAAQVTINGTAGQTVDIRCTSSATIGSGNDKLTLSPVKASVGTGQTYAAATACNGTNRTVLSTTLSSNGALNVVFLGGQLQTSGKSPTSTTYSSTGGGGASPVTLRVIFN